MGPDPVDELVLSARDGFPLGVQTGGAADAPALLLLQGQANSHVWWDGLRPAFGSEFRTITMDYRGTGRSRGKVGSWTTARFASDAVEVLDRLGVDRAVVYGTSMGGRIAQLIAVDHPDRVTALVLACTTPGGLHAVDRGTGIRRALARATPEDRQTILHELFYTPAWPHPPSASTLLGDRSMNALEAAAHLRASDRHDAWDALPSITAPTLILHGEDDRMTPVENAALLAERIPGARLELYPRARHGFFDECSARVNATVLEFAREHSATRRPPR